MTTMEFSFGVEIEAIFFFHKTLRQREPIAGSKGLFHFVDPLTVAAELLQSLSFSHKICTDPKSVQYDCWHITTDPSLFSHCGPEEKRNMLRSRFSEDGFVPEDWEHIGIELVSPPFKIAELARIKAEIVELTKVLASDNTALLITPKCGLHVHVGRLDNSLMPISFLHDLIMSTLLHESEIAKLHAPRRRSHHQCLSNRSSFTAVNDEHKDVMYDKATGKSIKSVILGVAELEKLVRSLQTHRELAELMQPRTLIVNWLNISGDGGRPRTIEFRQHDGTLDASEIQHWVTFLSCLVNAVANGPGLPRMSTWAENVTVEEVMEAIELPLETCTYYQQKLQGYELEMVGQPENNYASVWEPQCATQ